MIPIKKITKDQAKEFVDFVDSMSDAEFADMVERWHSHKIDSIEDNDIGAFREKILKAYDDGVEAGGQYEIDLNVGLCLYEELNLGNGFSLIMANDDDIWRYLSCKVFPDITYERYPKPAKGDIRLNKKRFYLHTRRIWLKIIWWYVFLSWQGDKEKTRDVLKDCVADTISDLVERTSRGYRVLLYRTLMKSYAGVKNKSTELFNRLLQQNLVNCRTVEPALVDGAEQGYVDLLFKQLSIGDNNAD